MNTALTSLGYATGTLNDKLFAWAGDFGGTGNNLNDRLGEALIASTGSVGGKALVDTWMEALSVLGYDQPNLNDRLNAFWADGGNLINFIADLTTSIVPTIGSLVSFSRAGTGEATVTDFEV